MLMSFGFVYVKLFAAAGATKQEEDKSPVPFHSSCWTGWTGEPFGSHSDIIPFFNRGMAPSKSVPKKHGLLFWLSQVTRA